MTNSDAVAARWFFSDRSLRCANLPRGLRGKARDLASAEPAEGPKRSVVVTMASEVITDAAHSLPNWAIGADTWYLVLVDVPVPALMRLPAALRLHRPDQRLHATQDPLAVRRLVVAQARRHPFEGVVDAYPLVDSLVLVLGDLTIRSLPVDQVPPLREMPRDQWYAFEIDEDGSFLYWPASDLHLGVSQMLQAVDPSYLADVEIERYSKDHTGEAVCQMREARGLRQADIPGLSERQVRRIEQGISRLTADAASKFATAFDLSLPEFLDAIASRAAQLRAAQESGEDDPIDDTRRQEGVAAG